MNRITSFFKKHPDLIYLAEIFPPLIIFFVYVWVLRPLGNRVVDLTAVLSTAFFLIVPMVAHGESAKELGLRFDNIRSFRKTWPVILFIYLVSEAVIIYNEAHKLPVGFVTGRHILYWFFWATLQQFIVQSFFYIRIEKASGNRYVAIAGAALIFSLMHAMNVPLMVLTFFGGLIICWMFSVRRNVFLAGLSHAVISLVIQVYLVPWVLPDMVFGSRTVVEYTDYTAYGDGVKVAAGDVNADGRLEVITAKGPHPQNNTVISVFSSEGKLLSSFHAFGKEARYGVNIAAGDVNGDGVDEIVAGAGISPSNKPEVKVFDWEGNELASFIAFSSWKDCGVNVAAGDIDGDGIAEVIAGSSPGLFCLPEIRVFNIRGERLKRLYPYNRDIRERGKRRYGSSIACGNIADDGACEFMAGLGHLRENSSDIKILDSNKNEIAHIVPFPGTSCGVNIAAGDTDGDGYDELVVSPGPHESNPAVFKVIDSNMSTVLEHRVYPEYVYNYGLNVAAGDFDCDGKADIVTGPGPGPDYPPEVKILRITEDGSVEIISRFLAY